MPTEPKFAEMQKVGPLHEPSSEVWREGGLIVALLWSEHSINPEIAAKVPPFWLYKIQTGPNDDLVDIWWPESKLEAR